MIITVEKTCEKPNLIHQVLMSLYGPGKHSITTLEPVYRLLILRATLVAYGFEVDDLKGAKDKTGAYPLALKTALKNYREWELQFNQAEQALELPDYIESNGLDREKEYASLGEWYKEAHEALLAGKDDYHAK